MADRSVTNAWSSSNLLTDASCSSNQNSSANLDQSSTIELIEGAMTVQMAQSIAQSGGHRHESMASRAVHFDWEWPLLLSR
jgi:hypothetical protein